MSSKPDTTGRLTYTAAEIEAYYNLLSIPTARRLSSISGLTDAEKLSHLRLLIKHSLVRIPFENLTLHYSWHKAIHVRPSHVLNKVVSQPGRGGYCMEINTVFHTVLLTLGYDVYMAGARVWDHTYLRYGGFTHCVNIVTIAEERYVVDVGFGPNAPTTPLPLVGAEREEGVGEAARNAEGGKVDVHVQIPPAKIRLLHEPIHQGVNSNSNNKVWRYQILVTKNRWLHMYCFVDIEFLPEDIAVINLWPSTERRSVLTQMVLCVRYTTDREVDGTVDSAEPAGGANNGVTGDDTGLDLLGDGPGRIKDEDIEGQIDGNLIMWGESFRWRRNGDIVLERKIKTDPERIEILRRYFGIHISEEDAEGIRGTSAALPEI